jgi:cation diffusion facilitator family transporter
MDSIEASGRFSTRSDWKAPIPAFRKKLADALADYKSSSKPPSDDVMEYYEGAVAQAEACELQYKLQLHWQSGTLLKGKGVTIDVDAMQREEDGNCDDGLSPSLANKEGAGASVVEEVDPSTLALGARASFALNVLLLCMKSLAAYRTGSTTIFASLLDSILDLMSGGIMLFVGHVLETSKREKYPTGKHHFEPLGTLVFACAMFVAATKLIQNCVEEIINISDVSFVMDFISIFILIFVIASKSFAAFWCFRHGEGSAMLTALAEDHRNDIVANIVAVIGFLAASNVTVWADPILGLGVTFFILRVWGGTILEQVHALSGHVADKNIVNQITAIARNHDSRVVAVDTVRVVTSGTGYVAEVDIVLPPEMTLEEAHGIGESLQVLLESMPGLGVNRAYVHLDVETDHDPHFHL